MIRRILLSWWLPTALLVGAEALVATYVGEQHGSPASTGVLLAAFPAGAAVGDLVFGRWVAPAWRRRSVPWLLTCTGVGLLPLGWHPPTALGAACLAVASVGTAYQLGGQGAFLGAVPVTKHGLAFGLFSTGLMAGQGVGPLLSGILADAVGAGTTIAGLGVAILVATLCLGRLPSEPIAAKPRRAEPEAAR